MDNSTITAASEAAHEADNDLPSCDGCRRRKLRCSREWPTCSHCRRLASRCTYEYQRKKPGLRGGAVEALSRRVEALENAVFDNPEEPRAVQTSLPTGPPQLPSPAPTSGDAHVLTSILSHLAHEIHSLNSNLATPAPTATIGPVVTPSPSSINHSTHEEGASFSAENPRKRLRLSSHSWLDSSNARIASSNTILTRAGVLEKLLDVYFQHIHHWIPILHEARFRSRLVEMKDHDKYSTILHAILVAALRLVDEKKIPISTQDIQDEVKRSRQHVVLNAMEDLTLENLQALVIIAFTDIGHGETTKAWSIIGSLARTVQYLHLSVEKTDLVEPIALLSNLPSIAPPLDWIEEEEQRRLFWNIFLLDRFCSITTGWNVSLTADDVSRRLPIDGGLWARNQPAITPYLGIWDHSAAKIGHTITFLPSKYDSNDRNGGSGAVNGTAGVDRTRARQRNSPASVEMLKIGAFAFYVESVESLSRINTYFVQQKIDFTNRQEVSSWLTRFKELDLRLVHWKMFLPQKWKNPNVDSVPANATPFAMDPNMTLAHITHNASSILLHQKIAYPNEDLKHLKLPNACSADTCYVAATETSNIAMKYLEHAPVRRVVAPHFAICMFVSAKVLLAHSQYYQVELAPEFWTLIECLETMSTKWRGRLTEVEVQSVPLAGSLAAQLRELQKLCLQDPTNNPLASFDQRQRERSDTYNSAPAMITRPSADDNHQTSDKMSTMNGANPQGANASQPTPSEGHCADQTLHAIGSPQCNVPGRHDDFQPDIRQDLHDTMVDATPDELSAISNGLMDQSFVEMNRIINFDDFMFITNPDDFPNISQV